MTLEMGKPLRAGIDEALKCARGCRYYAEHGARFLADEHVCNRGEGKLHPVRAAGRRARRDAVELPVLAGVPLRRARAHGRERRPPQARLQRPAVRDRDRGHLPPRGFPDGAFQTLLIRSADVAPLLEDSRISAVTLTGSEGAGQDVASRAGGALKKTVLELGGSDPFIVMPSADIAKAAATAVKARMVNNGQSCIAAKRFIVSEAIADEFLRLFVDGMRALRVGDPMEASTDVGPLATPELVTDLEAQVRATVHAGARVLTGGTRLPGPGNYFAPTVLVDIPPGSPAYREELFGPVASVYRVQSADEAIRLANDSTFGLGSSVWTNDDDERARFVREIEAGQVFVNAMVVSDPRLPFGGVKRSGYGRELGVHGIREFVNVKTVWVAD